VRAESAALQAEIAALCDDLRRRYAQTDLSHVPGVQAVRATYRAIGVDPTKYRPSSEALLHRVLKG
jgi:DNA/RNA-binding domain of Phe-tRNA-synthetase-like protein